MLETQHEVTQVQKHNGTMHFLCGTQYQANLLYKLDSHSPDL
jgi:hypothetical protein